MSVVTLPACSRPADGSRGEAWLRKALFRPDSIAIIGASSDPAKLGGRPVDYLKRFGFAGRIYPVNGSGGMVQGLPAFRSVADLPETPDQALVIVPAHAVEAALEACAARGILLVQVLSSGFAEEGPEGAARQERILALARRAGIRITGPNALGSVSVPDGLFATFTTTLDSMRFRPGRVAFVTQSGAFGSHAYACAHLRGIGMSRAVATGNEADLDVAECIALLAGDEGTSVICAALEGCRDGTRLRTALLKAARAGKPVIVMKVGASEAGAAAAATHTGSLAGEDRVYDAVLREGGAWRAQSIEEMIDIAQLCSLGRMPGGRDVGIVSISGGIGVLMADAASTAGLSLPPFPPEVLGAVAESLPAAAGVNPVDTTANAIPRMDAVETLIGSVLERTAIPTVVTYFAHTLRNPALFAKVEQGFRRLRQRYPDRLLVAVTTQDETVRDQLGEIGIPVFDDPSRAMRAVGAASALPGLQAAAEALPAVSPPYGGAIDARHEAGAKALLAAAGVPVLPERVVTDAAGAVAAAEAVGYPVVAKILSEDIPHKTEIGGVLLGLADAASVEAGFRLLMDRAGAHAPMARIDGVLIAPMAGKGLETIIGVQQDPVFGPMVMFGLGGIAVELFQDVAFGSAPLSPTRAARLVDQVRGASRLLQGWRGGPPLDRDGLITALCRVSELAASRAAEIRSVEINPLLVRPEGAVALDALVVSGPPAV
ncbi:acetate--CoA ligase family protein [Roseomonas chloroacetimidivorans]|uniref:acetate--CoA ligase family protein n=1 Tax=Roseomonas chloroacetimidivorans TaxID=1766656 RepID=UPI003C711325